MATRRIPITGGKEVAEALRKLGVRIETNVMRAAMNAGAAVIGKQARQNARGLNLSSSGKRRLAKAIRWKRARTKKGRVAAGVYLASDPKPYSTKAGTTYHTNDPRVWGMMLERGTTDRWTGGRSKGGAWRASKSNPGGKRAFRGRIVAQPFLRPALDSQTQAALDQVRDYARERIPKEVEKLAAKRAGAKAAKQ